MTKERIDFLTSVAFGIFGLPNDIVEITRSKLKDMFGYVKQAERRHLKQVTRFRLATENDFHMGMHTLDQTDPEHIGFAKKNIVMVFSNKGFLVMQTGHGETGLFPGSKVTRWTDAEIVDIFNG